jgi:hypothetical protein
LTTEASSTHADPDQSRVVGAEALALGTALADRIEEAATVLARDLPRPGTYLLDTYYWGRDGNAGPQSDHRDLLPALPVSTITWTNPFGGRLERVERQGLISDPPLLHFAGVKLLHTTHDYRDIRVERRWWSFGSGVSGYRHRTARFEPAAWEVNPYHSPHAPHIRVGLDSSVAICGTKLSLIQFLSREHGSWLSPHPDGDSVKHFTTEDFVTRVVQMAAQAVAKAKLEASN